MSRTPAVVGLVLALVVPLTGCDTPFGGSDPSPSRPASSSPSPEAKGAGRQVTDEQAKAALPTRPEGATAASTTSTSDDRETDPEECLDILRLGPEETALRKVRVANATQSWSTRSPVVTHTFRVDSYSRPVGSTLLDRAGAAMGNCQAFSLIGTDDDGPFDLRVLAEPRALSTIGEQNFAVRIISFAQENGKTSRVYLDYVVVRQGHNLVEVTSAHRVEGRGFGELEKSAQDILDKLEETP